MHDFKHGDHKSFVTTIKTEEIEEVGMPRDDYENYRMLGVTSVAIAMCPKCECYASVPVPERRQDDAVMIFRTKITDVCDDARRLRVIGEVMET